MHPRCRANSASQGPRGLWGTPRPPWEGRKVPELRSSEARPVPAVLTRCVAPLAQSQQACGGADDHIGGLAGVRTAVAPGGVHPGPPVEGRSIFDRPARAEYSSVSSPCPCERVRARAGCAGPLGLLPLCALVAAPPGSPALNHLLVRHLVPPPSAPLHLPPGLLVTSCSLPAGEREFPVGGEAARLPWRPN